MTSVRRVLTADLRRDELTVLRALFDEAWKDDDAFTDHDWDHALGGTHFVVEEDGVIVSHASVVQRELHTGGHELTTEYVEAVATAPGYRRRGHATAIMREVGAHLDHGFQLGALGTGLTGFYERLGWMVWRGPTGVRTDDGLVLTPEEDGQVMVRLTPASPPLDLAVPMTCEWRPGDVW